MENILPVLLIAGTHPWNGRVEIFHDGQWGTVCNDGFITEEARVVCRQLGYYGGRVSISRIIEGTGQIWLDDVNCSGNELSLAACEHRRWGVNNCGHHEDVVIECGDFHFLLCDCIFVALTASFKHNVSITLSTFKW